MLHMKKYVAEHYDGMKGSSLNIAQVKRKCGIELGENLIGIVTANDKMIISRYYYQE